MTPPESESPKKMRRVRGSTEAERAGESPPPVGAILCRICGRVEGEDHNADCPFWTEPEPCPHTNVTRAYTATKFEMWCTDCGIDLTPPEPVVAVAPQSVEQALEDAWFAYDMHEWEAERWLSKYPETGAGQFEARHKELRTAVEQAIAATAVAPYRAALMDIRRKMSSRSSSDAREAFVLATEAYRALASPPPSSAPNIEESK